MIELLRGAAAEEPGRVAVLTHTDQTSYAALVDRAERVAAALRRSAIDRFALLETDAATVIAVLAGAALAGAEPCQYPPNATPDEVADLAARFDHDLLLTDRDDLAVPGLAVRRPADLDADPTPDGVPAGRPLLVLTTGTTGKPRGVRHDWSRLLSSTDRIRQGAGQRWLLAYGLHQFAGLQILVHVLAAGATLVAPAPRRPREGLVAMRELGVTHASATPTYWRFLLAEMRADAGPVPALHHITLGGEAAPGPLLAELGRLFPGVPLSHVYAASEFGSTGSERDGLPGLSVRVLERGEDAAVRLRVVDGELWVRSISGMLGYYGEPPVDADGWRPTGDLVEVVGDRILFRGRSSEVVNVGGVKVHPLPIEERVSAVPGVAVARVFGRPNAVTGAIVAVEVVPDGSVDEAALDAAVRAACEDLPAAARPRSVRIVAELAMAGDKIVRSRPDES
ncbi:MAG: class I adenylate-forming enzyme family protein [Marmoricola sp.]